MRPVLSLRVMIPAAINAEMSGGRWHRPERMPAAKYYAGDSDYSE